MICIYIYIYGYRYKLFLIPRWCQGPSPNEDPRPRCGRTACGDPEAVRWFSQATWLAGFSCSGTPHLQKDQTERGELASSESCFMGQGYKRFSCRKAHGVRLRSIAPMKSVRCQGPLCSTILWRSKLPPQHLSNIGVSDNRRSPNSLVVILWSFHHTSIILP